MSDRVINEVNALIKSGTDVSYEELKVQITKDLQLAGISYLPDETENLTELISWTSSLCRHLIEKDFQTYMNLLYRIDVPAERFMKMNEENPNYDSNEIAALLLIKREVQKIRLRKSY
ncbi:MAG: hypothetical protein ABFR62_06350 [Bacteroidota bacterium]